MSEESIVSSTVNSEFAALRRKLRLTQGQVAAALGLNREHVRELETGRRPVYPLHRLALEHLRWEIASDNADVVTARMLTCAQKMLEGVGYRVVPKN